MKKSVLALAAAALVLSQVAVADEALATKSGCMACHQLTLKVVGPAYKDVATKYAGDAAAEATLIEKVKAGGVGNWGQVPMPPKGGNPAVSDEDVATLVKWILSLAAPAEAAPAAPAK
jgi:cytochrome c